MVVFLGGFVVSFGAIWLVLVVLVAMGTLLRMDVGGGW